MVITPQNYRFRIPLIEYYQNRVHVSNSSTEESLTVRSFIHQKGQPLPTVNYVIFFFFGCFCFEELCPIWYHLYVLKNVENSHGGVLLLLKSQTPVCNFSKSNYLQWVIFTFLNCTNGAKSRKAFVLNYNLYMHDFCPSLCFNDFCPSLCLKVMTTFII